MIIYLYGEMEKCMPSEQTYTARSLYKDSGARVFLPTWHWDIMHAEKERNAVTTKNGKVATA